MALATLNGLGIIQGRIAMPRQGNWSADLVVDAQDITQLQNPLLLQLGDSEADASLSLKGVLFRGGDELEVVTLKMIGGAGGLATILPPKYYQGCQLQLPLTDGISAGGEMLSPTSLPSILNTPLPFWTRAQGFLADLLADLVGVSGPGATWRVLPDGTIWIGVETWPAADITSDLLVPDEYLAREDLGVEVPTLLPGTTFKGRRVSFVEHLIKDREVRSVVHYEQGATIADRAKQGLAAFMGSLERPNLYLTSPVGTVVQQRQDLTLDIKLDDPRFPGLTSVPMRTPFPGLVVKLSPGGKQRVRITFDNGNPGKPGATLFDCAAGSIQSVAIGGTQAIPATHPLVMADVYLPAEAAALSGANGLVPALAALSAQTLGTGAALNDPSSPVGGAIQDLIAALTALSTDSGLTTAGPACAKAAGSVGKLQGAGVAASGPTSQAAIDAVTVAISSLETFTGNAAEFPTQVVLAQ